MAYWPSKGRGHAGGLGQAQVGYAWCLGTGLRVAAGAVWHLMQHGVVQTMCNRLTKPVCLRQASNGVKLKILFLALTDQSF